MNDKIFDIVWDAVDASPQDAENMRLRSQLMIDLTERIAAQGWTDSAAAQHLGVTEPRISDLLGGQLQLFSLDSLVNMIAAAGMQVEVRVTPAGARGFLQRCGPR
jgi:predicted XRE-type DNA-binding protein